MKTQEWKTLKHNAGLENMALEGAGQLHHWKTRECSGVNGSVTLGGWLDAKGKVSWETEVTQWGPGAKTQ